jgi:MFS family permease
MNRRPLLRLFFVLLLVVIELGIALPVLPALALALGANGFDVGLLYAIQSFGQLAMSPFWGGLSDRFGRKRILIVTILLVAVAEFATAFAPSLLLLFAARLLVGLCAGQVATASALVADVTDVENRSRGMAVIGIAFGLGFTIGPAVGAGLGFASAGGPGPLGDGLPFLAAGGLGLLNVLLAAAVLTESVEDVEERAHNRRPRPTLAQLRELLRAPAVHAMLVLNFLYTMSASVLESTFFVFMDHRYQWDERQVGFVFAGLGLTMALAQGGVGPVSRRFGDRKMTIFGAILIALGLVTAPVFHAIPLLVAFLGLATVGRAFAHPGILSLTSKTSHGERDAGRVMGALQSANSLGRIVGPAVGGALFTYAAPEVPFVAAGFLVAAGIAWWSRRPV